jgi:hypothetical protein
MPKIRGITWQIRKKAEKAERAVKAANNANNTI